jgi:hypothetical protein
MTVKNLNNCNDNKKNHPELVLASTFCLNSTMTPAAIALINYFERAKKTRL